MRVWLVRGFHYFNVTYSKASNFFNGELGGALNCVDTVWFRGLFVFFGGVSISSPSRDLRNIVGPKLSVKSF